MTPVHKELLQLVHETRLVVRILYHESVRRSSSHASEHKVPVVMRSGTAGSC